MDIERIRGIIKLMRVGEKAALMGGGKVTAAIARPRVNKTDLGDGLAPYDIAEPVELALGCTFSPELCAAVAAARIYKAVQKHQAFAGAVSAGLIRDPMRADASEFFSEDAFLTSELLKGFSAIDGMGFVFRDCLGQGSYAVRTVDARALRELYLMPLARMGKFAAALKLDGGYLNDEHVSSSAIVYDLYTKYIRSDVMVFTQYGSAHGENSAEIIGNGGSYLLGISGDAKRTLTYDVSAGLVAEPVIDKMTERTLTALVNSTEYYSSKSSKMRMTEMPDLVFDSAVLLKNDGILPAQGRAFTLFGDAEYFADGDRYEIGDTVDAIDNLGALNVFLLTGYEDTGISERTANVIRASAAVAPAVVVLCGYCAAELGAIEESASAILFCPARPRIKHVLELITTTAPRGRLPFTWLRSREDHACNNRKFARRGDFRYDSMYNGYLLYNNFGGDVAFPFGHGLDYNNYEISQFTVKANGTDVTMEFTVKNKGKYYGTCVCQAYMTHKNPPVYGLSKRLVAFKRVEVPVGKTLRVTLSADMNDFAVYDESADNFAAVGGKYIVELGLSSVDIRATGECKVGAGSRSNAGLNAKIAPAYYALGKPFAPTAPEIEKLLKVPFIKKTEDHAELAPPSEAYVKKTVKKLSKTVPPHLMPLVRYKAATTPVGEE